MALATFNEDSDGRGGWGVRDVEAENTRRNGCEFSASSSRGTGHFWPREGVSRSEGEEDRGRLGGGAVRSMFSSDAKIDLDIFSW